MIPSDNMSEAGTSELDDYEEVNIGLSNNMLQSMSRRARGKPKIGYKVLSGVKELLEMNNYLKCKKAEKNGYPWE